MKNADLVRQRLRDGKISRVNQLFRQVGDNQALVEIEGVKFVVDHIAVFELHGIRVNSRNRKTHMKGLKTVGDVVNFFKNFPEKINNEDFKALELKIK